jgi:tetratricopeptide (TPR) repeat protein
MASVFLSYDRDDAKKARPIALALEQAGHSVWWDLHIRGGAQFSKVIEEALKASDVVVVLWSANSIESPWVRDEAGAGRDTGRLVPVTIDGTPPPLGFRQFQTIDFTRWKGRGAPSELRTLLADIDSTATSSTAAGTAEAAPSAVRSSAGRRPVATARSLLLGAGAIAALLLAGGVYWLFASDRARTPTISVIAADATPLSQSMTRDALATLGSMHGISEANFRLVDAQSREPADLRVTISGSSGDGQAQANIAIVSPSENSVLWSKQLALPAAAGTNLGRSVAYAASRALACAMDDFSGTYGTLNSEQLHRYLNACASAPDRHDPQTVIPVFRKITKEVPKFVPAWTQLLIAEMDRLNLVRDDAASARALMGDIRADIASARRADADLAEATLAESQLLAKTAFLQKLQLLGKAKAQHADNAAVLSEEADVLFQVGRRYDALVDLQHAVDFIPYAPGARVEYILALSYSGGIDKARDELAKAKQLWPDSPEISRADEAIELRFGDVEKAMLSRGPVDGGLAAYLNARKSPTNANIDAFVNLAKNRELNAEERRFVYQAFPELNRSDVLYGYIERWPIEQDLAGETYILFRPWLRDFRRDPRFMRVAQRVGLLDYWEKSGKWPDFCEEPDMPYDCKKEAAKLTA